MLYDHILCCYSNKPSDNSTVDHARPAATPHFSSSNNITLREQQQSVITSVPKSVTTDTIVIDCDSRDNNNAYLINPRNDVVDELDDDLDAAMMDVDLNIFDDDLVDENCAGHKEVTSENSATGVSNVPMDISNRISSLNTISDISTIVKDKCFHGTLRIKVCIISAT